MECFCWFCVGLRALFGACVSGCVINGDREGDQRGGWDEIGFCDGDGEPCSDCFGFRDTFNGDCGGWWDGAACC